MRNVERIVISCRLNAETQYSRPNMNLWNNLQKTSKLNHFASACGAGSLPEHLWGQMIVVSKQHPEKVRQNQETKYNFCFPAVGRFPLQKRRDV